jgi:hypothetical protein
MAGTARPTQEPPDSTSGATEKLVNSY